MAVTTYLERNNLHFKPISARLTRGVIGASTAVMNSASETKWHGKVVRLIGKGTLLTGSVLSVPVALIELLSLTLIGTTGLAFNKLLYKNQSLFLQKHSLKSLSYALHSGTMVVALLLLIRKLPHIHLYTVQALMDYTLYLGTAGAVQHWAGIYLDPLAGRDPDLAVTRPLYLLVDNYQMVGNDIVHQIQYDFNITLRSEWRQTPALQAYLVNHPQDREFIASFDLRRMFTDRAYRGNAIDGVMRFLRESRVLNQANISDGNLFDLNQATKQESDYQNHLANTLKEAFIEIHSDDTLSSYLDEEGSKGKERLEVIDAGIYTQLATYTQYKEILGPLLCPSSFTTPNLRQYNGRHQELLSLKTDLATFTEQQKVDLVRKILQGADFAVTDPVQVVYNKIGQLVSALTQGPLMTRVSLDLRALDNGDQIMQSRNLFQNACQEAVAAVTPVEV